MNTLYGVAAILSSVALGASRKPLTPGQQITQIYARYDNIIAELTALAGNAGNCRGFLRLYNQYAHDIEKADRLFASQKQIDRYLRSAISDHMAIVADYAFYAQECKRMTEGG
jgi:hypothetical protein